MPSETTFSSGFACFRLRPLMAGAPRLGRLTAATGNRVLGLWSHRCEPASPPEGMMLPMAPCTEPPNI